MTVCVNGAGAGSDCPERARAEGDERSTFRREDPPAPGVGAAPVGAGAPTDPPCTFCPAVLRLDASPDGWQVFEVAEPLRWQVDAVEESPATVEMRAGVHLVCPTCSPLVAGGKVAQLLERLANWRHPGVAMERPSESAAMLSAFVGRLTGPVAAVDWRST